MGGGPSSSQKQAAASEARLADTQARNSDQMMQVYQNQLGKIEPFATERMKNGLPFYNSLTDYAGGTNAQAFAPGRASLERTLSNYGSLPSGFRTQALADFDANRARGFDQAMTQNLMGNEQAKTNAAGMLVGQQQLANPLGWSSAASQGYNGIMNAPLASPGLGGMLGGLAGGAMMAF